MLNAARTMTYAANYDPYGQVMAQYLPNATPSFGFTGQMTDASGLQYLRARYYDPSLGVFLSQDPVQGMLGGASIRWNPYIYAGGNPTSNIDPDGRCFFGIDTIYCVAAGLFALGAAMDVGSQMALGGKALHEVDMLSAGVSGATTVFGGAAGFASGTLIRRAGLTGIRALAAGGLAAAADFGVGVAADHYLLGDSLGSAVFGNAIGFGLGEVAGYGVKFTGHGIQSGLRKAGRGIQAGARRLTSSAGGFSGIKFVKEVQNSPVIINQQYPMSCVPACGTQWLRDLGIDITEDELVQAMKTSYDYGTDFINAEAALNQMIRGTSLGGNVRFESVMATSAISEEWLRGMINAESPVIIRMIDPTRRRGIRHAILVDSVDGNLVHIRDPYGNGPGTSMFGSSGTITIEHLYELFHQEPAFIRLKRRR